MVRSPALKQRRPRLALYILAAIVTGGMLWSRTGSLGRWAAAPGSSLAAAWAEAANVTLAAQLPGWALCPQPPCQYGHLEDGDVDPASEPWHSVFGEDEWLFNNIFYMKRNGFILEFGAMDGVAASNSLFLAKAAGWKSMLIEACPSQYANLARNRPDAINLHAAVCGDFRTVHWHSAGSVGGIYEFMAPGFLEEFHRGLTPGRLPEIPCVPLMFLLDKFGVNTIDIWSLDVEGGELEVLQTVDFSRLNVGVLVVETDGNNKTKDAAVHALMDKAGFSVVPKGPVFNHVQKMDSIFINNAYRHHLRHAPNITTVQT